MSVSAQPPPQPPRPLTARVRARVWADPLVRFWWAAGAVVLVAGLYLIGVQAAAWRHGAWLVRNGTPVTGTIVEADGDRLVPPAPPGQRPRGRQKPPTAIVTLEFPWAGGATRRVAGRLDGRRPGDFVAVNDLVPLRVNPQDPDDWTARAAPAPLGLDLLGGGMAVLIAAAAFIVAAALRRRVLRTWRDGAAAEALVVGQQQTALAPRARAVRCTLLAGRSRRVFTVFVPSRAAAPRRETGEDAADAKEIVWVIHPPAGGRAVAAAWFE